MDRKEASSCLKELLAKCDIASDSFMLIEPNRSDTLSKGYKIRIMASMSNACREQVKTITKKHDLAVIEEQNQIIAYKPKSTQIDNV
ncbi:MAG: hypothetical protein ABSD92_13860 [Candidatus Bathyarchaeia archaeon]